MAKENLYPRWGKTDEDFETVFGVFFPSVIGIFAGASMSGDLKNPNEAIPKGNINLILTFGINYLTIELIS